MTWASLAMLFIVVGTTLRGAIPLDYSTPIFIALHPAVPLASIPALFDLERTPTAAAFVLFIALTATAAVLLTRLQEWGRKLARWMSVLGALAAIVVVPVRTLTGAFTVAAVVLPYALIFLYLGRDYVELRFQMAKPGKPPAHKMFRPEN